MLYRPHTSRYTAPKAGRVQVRDSIRDMIEFASASPTNTYRLCGKNPTHQQAEVFDFIGLEYAKPLSRRQRRIAIRSGKGIGKTELLACVALWWNLLHSVGTLWFQTAPTQRQLRDAFLPTFAQLVAGAPKLFQKFVQVYGDSVGFGGRRPADWGVRTGTAVAEVTAQGLHRDHLAIGIDEASGVSRAVYNAMDQTLSNDDHLFLLTGNANHRDGPFYDAFYGGASETWKHFQFSSEDSPIVSKDLTRRLEMEFGRESDFFRVAVLGEFPSNSPQAILDFDSLMACTRNRMVTASLIRSGGTYHKQIGLDFARFGRDESVVVMRKGLALIHLHAMVKQEPIMAVRHAFAQQVLHEWKNPEVLYVPDADGLGGGVMHSFGEASKVYHEFHSQAVPTRWEYENASTEAWFEFAKLVKARNVFLPKDRLLLKQLEQRTYKIAPGETKLKVLSKDEEVKMERPSPDRADATVLAFYQGGLTVPQIASKVPEGQTRKRESPRLGRGYYNR